MELSKIYCKKEGFPKKIVNKILSNIKTFSHDKLKKEYVEELFYDLEPDFLIVVNDSNGGLRGFACISEYEDNGIESCKLDLLCCAKRHPMKRRSNCKIPNGKYLLDKIENFVRFGNKYIEVDAISTAILYYYKNGYNFKCNKYQKGRLKRAIKKLYKIYNSNMDLNEKEDAIMKIHFLNRYINDFNNIDKMSNKKLWKDIEEDSCTLQEHRESITDDGYMMIKYFD